MRSYKFIVLAALATAVLAWAAIDASGQSRSSATLNSDAFGQAPDWRSSGGQSFFDRWTEDVILQSGDVDFRAGYLRELQNDRRNCTFSPVEHHEPELRRHYVLTTGECSWDGMPYQVMYAVRWERENIMALKCISFIGRTPAQTTEFGLAEKGFYRGGESPLPGINRRLHAARSCTEEPLEVALHMSGAWFHIGVGINAGRMRRPSALDMCLNRCQPLDPVRQDRNACYEACFQRQ